MKSQAFGGVTSFDDMNRQHEDAQVEFANRDRDKDKKKSDDNKTPKSDNSGCGPNCSECGGGDPSVPYNANSNGNLGPTTLKQGRASGIRPQIDYWAVLGVDIAGIADSPLSIWKGITKLASVTKSFFSITEAAKASTNAFKHSYKYADRIRVRGVQDPVSHNFPYSFDDAILSTDPILKNNGYKIFQQSGTMNGKNVFFEIGLTKDGIIDHRFFRPIK